MNRCIILALFLLILTGCSRTVKYALVIRNVGFFDGNQDRGIVNIAVNADTIAAISHKRLKSVSIVDGRNKYIIPGLVNAHVHVSVPSDLKAGYQFGILTLLNMHTGMEERELKWKKISRDSIGFSSLYGAGYAATVPGGHPSQFSPNMQTINDSTPIKHWVDNRIAQNVDYIKIVRDHHEWMGEPPLPTLSYEQIKQIIAYAHSKGYKVVVHASTVEEMRTIATFEPDGFVHMPDYKEDYPIAEDYYRGLAESGVFIVPTGGMALKRKEKGSPFIKEWILNNLLNANQRAEIIQKFHEYGILIVAGTDAQQGQMNFGQDYFYELELYKKAGLSNVEILKTATGNAAKAFSLPIGTLQVGSKADMILLTDSPITDIENLKKIEEIWKNGRSR